jgi:hypothetical protein
MKNIKQHIVEKLQISRNKKRGISLEMLMYMETTERLTHFLTMQQYDTEYYKIINSKNETVAFLEINDATSVAPITTLIVSDRTFDELYNDGGNYLNQEYKMHELPVYVYDAIHNIKDFYSEIDLYSNFADWLEIANKRKYGTKLEFLSLMNYMRSVLYENN